MPVHTRRHAHLAPPSLALAAALLAPLPAQDLRALEEALAETAARVSAASVLVEVTTPDGEMLSFSGILWDRQGRVVLPAGALPAPDEGEVMVTGPAGDRVKAQVLGVDHTTGVGVVQAADLSGDPLVLADTSKLQRGHILVVVGNPFGLRASLSTGMVTGAGRTLQGDDVVYLDLVQTNVPANPGDAGAPVGNSRGELVGMLFSTYGRAPRSWAEEQVARLRRAWKELDAAIRDESWMGSGAQEDLREGFESFRNLVEKLLDGEVPTAEEPPEEPKSPAPPARTLPEFAGTEGIAFVLPVEQIQRSVVRILKGGTVRRPWMGVTVAPEEGGAGARVLEVARGGPGLRAGLHTGDRIVSWDGSPVSDLEDLVKRIHASQPGSTHRVGLRRGEESLELDVILDEAPGTPGGAGQRQ